MFIINYILAILFLIAGFVESIQAEPNNVLALGFFQMSLLIQIMGRVENVQNKIEQKE